MITPANHTTAKIKTGTTVNQLLPMLDPDTTLVTLSIARNSLPRTTATSDRPDTLASQERDTGERYAAVMTSVREINESSKSTTKQIAAIAK